MISVIKGWLIQSPNVNPPRV